MTAATRAVALDGPSGSGKSTVARRVASALGWHYVDTGATYRAITLAALRSGIRTDDMQALARLVQQCRVEQDTDPSAPATRLDGEDVTAELRSPQVTAAVSAVSAVPAVRHRLTAVQRQLAGTDGAVVEGRDVGAVVLPDAAVKVYLDASPDERARRRAGDRYVGVSAAGVTGDLHAAVAADLARRDELDRSRAVSPLAVAPGAVVVDTSAMGVEQVVEVVLDLVRRAGLVARS